MTVWVRLTGAALLLVLGAACAEGPGTAARGDQPGMAASWVLVSRAEVCTPPGNAPLCIDPEFRVNQEGRYGYVGTIIEGMLSPEEFAELDARAAAVAREELDRAPLACLPAIQIPEIAETQTRLELEGARSYLVRIHSAKMGICALGDGALAGALDETLGQLMRKHLPPG